ncbi:MAG: 50S ribosomal protein L25 [Dehalococcoidia bacterium]
MKQDELKANTRVVTGKKVKALRREGVIPINLYGPKMESISLQAETDVLRRLINKSGRNALISLKIEGDKKAKQVILRDVQRDALNGKLLHVDLFQVDMSHKLRVDVPIQFVGESAAAKSKRGMFIENMSSLHIEALPADIPQHIEVDISVLVEMGQAIHVRDLKLDSKLLVLNEPEQVIAKVMEAKIEVEPVAAAVPEEGEAAEGAEAAEGEAKKEGAAEPAKAEAKGKAKPEAEKKK